MEKAKIITKIIGDGLTPETAYRSEHGRGVLTNNHLHASPTFVTVARFEDEKAAMDALESNPDVVMLSRQVKPSNDPETPDPDDSHNNGKREEDGIEASDWNDMLAKSVDAGLFPNLGTARSIMGNNPDGRNRKRVTDDIIINLNA